MIGGGTSALLAQPLGIGVPEVVMYTRSYADRTLGNLYVRKRGAQVYSCHTLELPWKDNANEVSCVPAGIYTIELEHSAAFRMKLWELKGVPGRSEVKVHAANFPGQLKGCIGTATRLKDIDHDGKLDAESSRLALKGFMDAMGSAVRSRITIISLDDARKMAG